jgi:tetratricopeptide (TPR) repeat protein
VEGAIASFREALRLKKDYPDVHYHLGRALMRQGQFTQALAALRRGHELGSRDPKWPYPSARQVLHCERLLELDRRLPAVLRDEGKVSEAQTLVFAEFCRHYKRLYAAATRFYRDAFAAKPELADDLKLGFRERAACAAVLAGCGKGKDAGKLDEGERGRFRREALGWLRADLKLWARQAGNDAPEVRTKIRQALQHWQRNPDLAGVRDEKALGALPKREQEAWRQFWADVNALAQMAPQRP